MDVEYIRKGDEFENAAAPEANRPHSIEVRILRTGCVSIGAAATAMASVQLAGVEENAKGERDIEVRCYVLLLTSSAR